MIVEFLNKEAPLVHSDIYETFSSLTGEDSLVKELSKKIFGTVNSKSIDAINKVMQNDINYPLLYIMMQMKES